MSRSDRQREELLNEIFPPSNRQISTTRQYRMPLKLAFVVAFGILCLGVVIGQSGLSSDSLPPPVPTPTMTVTVTETTTKDRLPAACVRALAVMDRMMADNSAIASAGEKQLDLSHAARRAMFEKDWAALDRTMEEQTALNNSLDAPSTKALGDYADLKKAMKDCRDELD